MITRTEREKKKTKTKKEERSHNSGFTNASEADSSRERSKDTCAFSGCRKFWANVDKGQQFSEFPGVFTSAGL